MAVDSAASRQGITPMIVMFIVRYSNATSTTAYRMERGMVRAGSFTSPPK